MFTSECMLHDMVYDIDYTYISIRMDLDTILKFQSKS